MLKECLAPWISKRMNEVADEYEHNTKDLYEKFSFNLTEIKSHVSDRDIIKKLMELEELLNQLRDEVAPNAYAQGFDEALKLVLSIYKK